MSGKRVKVFVAQHCVPCQPLKEILGDGAFLINGEEGGSVEMVDIETEEGYTEMLASGVAAVPSAFIGKKQCEIKIDEDEGVVLLECPDDDDGPVAG